MSPIWLSVVSSLLCLIFSLSILVHCRSKTTFCPHVTEKCQGYNIISCGWVSSYLTFEFVFSSLSPHRHPHCFHLHFILFHCSILHQNFDYDSCEVTWLCFWCGPFWAAFSRLTKAALVNGKWLIMVTCCHYHFSGIHSDYHQSIVKGKVSETLRSGIYRFV